MASRPGRRQVQSVDDALDEAQNVENVESNATNPRFPLPKPWGMVRNPLEPLIETKGTWT